MRVELDERRGRGAADHPDREPLQGTSAVEPDRAAREREDDEPRERDAEPRQDHRPPAEAVREPAEEDQGRHEHDRVCGEDRSEHEAGEAELRRIDRVERRRQVRAGEQDEPTGPDDQSRQEAGLRT